MTRRDFIGQIAYDYAMFVRETKERHGLHVKVQPLDREFAFHRGQGYVASGAYVPRVRHLDYELIARKARKQLPRIDRNIALYDSTYGSDNDDGYMTDVIVAAADGATWS